MKGTIISAAEVKARWAYGEVTSDRFGAAYATHLPSDLFQRATAGRPFSEVPASEWPALIDVLENHARNKQFVDCIDTFGAPQYVWEEWNVTQLLNSVVIPAFQSSPYLLFLARPPAATNGVVDTTDPRHKSYSIPFDPDFFPGEPLTVIQVQSSYMLFEGYLRSILWLRNPTKPLPVWLPRK